MLYNFICRLISIQHIYVGWRIICRKLVSSKLFDICMSFKDLMTIKRILIRHIYTSVISWWSASGQCGLMRVRPFHGVGVRTCRVYPNCGSSWVRNSQLPGSFRRQDLQEFCGTQHKNVPYPTRLSTWVAFWRNSHSYRFFDLRVFIKE